jgi:hypothetical protein
MSTSTGTSPLGELDTDLTILALCLFSAALTVWIARSRTGEVRGELVKLAGAREAAQEQHASTLRELDQVRGQLEDVVIERDDLRRRLGTPEVGE